MCVEDGGVDRLGLVSDREDEGDSIIARASACRDWTWNRRGGHGIAGVYTFTNRATNERIRLKGYPRNRNSVKKIRDKIPLALANAAKTAQA